MKPYYQDNFVTLYNCANEDIISELEPAGLLLTDPPYGINEAAGKNKSRGCFAVSKDYGNLTWDSAAPPPRNFKQIHSVSKTFNNIRRQLLSTTAIIMLDCMGQRKW